MNEEIQPHLSRILLNILFKECQIDPKLPLLVGVSGGPDSLFMLDILHRLGFNLVAGHLDHMLRSESSAEAGSVKAYIQAAGLPGVVEKADVRAFARTNRLSIEAAARQLRYEFLFRQANIFGAQAVAVAHSADDQVETFLLHLLRGAGLDGLTGMPYRSLPNAWSQSIPLVRPILSIWRSEILQYLSERNIEPHWDASNADPAYLRNRVRHELIPTMEKYNPRIRQRLWQTSEILQQEDHQIQVLVLQAWQACLRQRGAGYLVLDKGEISALPLAIRRRVMRKTLSELLPGLANIEFDHIQKILQFIDQPTRRASEVIAAGISIFVENGLLWVVTQEAEIETNQWPQLPQSSAIPISLSGEVQISPAWVLKIRLLTSDQHNLGQATTNRDPYSAWLDLDSLSLPITFRCFRPGDRFQPLGMTNGSTKISDLFINHKLPRRARPGWPLAADNLGIIWVPGIGISERCRVNPGSKKILQLTLQKME